MISDAHDESADPQIKEIRYHRVVYQVNVYRFE